MTEQVVIGIDEGTASAAAVEWVIQRTGSKPVQIALVTAVDELMVDREQDERLELMRGRVAQHLPRAFVELVSAEGPLLHVMHEHAERADLLVLGNRRTRTIRSTLGGATALRVAAGSPIPVVLVPDDITGNNGSIVLGVAADGSSDGAIEFAASEASRANVPLDVVHAWGPSAAAEKLGFPDHPAEVVAEHRAILEAVAHRIRAEWPDLIFRDYLVGGDAAEALVARAARSRLIVVGTRGSNQLTGLMRGSVGQEVTRRSRVPVCIVPTSWRPTAPAPAG